MLQQLLMPSTDNPDSFSNGVSKSSFTQQWNLNISDANLQQTWGPGLPYGSSFPIFIGQESMPGADLYYAVVLQPGTSSLPEFSEGIERRINCFKFISTLPINALEEAIETLSDLSQFYMMRQQTGIALSSTNLSSSEHTAVKPEVGRTYDREDFYVDED